MSTNWSLPVLTSLYTDVLDILKTRDVDSLTLLSDTAATNIPENAFRFLRAQNVFQEYIASIWTTKIIALAGGGTGAANATDARTNLGLGTMATQNANNVAITGGTISGIASFNVSGAITAGSFTGNGAGLTNLNASQLTTGTLPDARFPAVLPALNGGNLTNLNAGALAFGTVPTARLGSGSAGTTTFLRGDQTWAAPPSAGGIPAGAIILFNASVCPPGFTRVAAWDGYYVRMGPVVTSGGSNAHNHGVGSYAAPAHTHGAGSLAGGSHNHGGSTGSVSITISGTTGSGGGHSHGYSGSISGTTGSSGDQMNVDAGGSGNMSRSSHTHSFSANYSDDTASVGGHTHSFSGSGSGTGSISSSAPAVTGTTASGGGGSITGASDTQLNMPLYVDMLACMKD